MFGSIFLPTEVRQNALGAEMSIQSDIKFVRVDVIANPFLSQS